MPRLTLDKSGRILLPKPLRDQLHLKPGDALEIETTGDQIALRPVRATGQLTKEQGVWVFRTGQALPASGTDATLQEIRKHRDQTNLSLDT